ncbi:MAG: hypothetical protein KJZ80_15610 [Hyphomicrobiaceae bacterium]|nr:hypothetical protein [Hyphomicrobiaceae bacterium]
MLRRRSSGAPHADRGAEAAPSPGLREPERLVGLGFRSWLAGYQTGDIACWEQAWAVYSNALGPQQARPAMTDLACWVRAIQNAACRSIEVYPAQCAGFCRDECMAIAMVAASQHGACPALRACAWALLESSTIDEVVEGAQCLGATLRSCDRILSSASICEAMALCPLRTPGRAN